ncbi:acyl-CoA dehydrogenase family protein [Albimonas sp. CAU 1670]|uniref:acyl-CoA dehydrogenase family protein n=1 Tax=Albimonas sp. CAU 1670 TaxID=3032599 RepID=UPI0023DC8C8E|nr:acyl-CoA dehydrogenase family protein [Albimonas sp. CAU 1670]MDF2234980.1 acyl-CoA dehydrogenase family protein [Albimonas sp. CAU 1670]
MNAPAPASTVSAAAERGFRLPEPEFVPEELRMLRAQVRRFVEAEIVPHGEAWEEAGEIPRELFRKLGALGLLGMQHEEAYGGSALGSMAAVVLSEELGRSTFGGVTAAVSVHTDMSACHLTRVGTEVQKAEWLPRACAGEAVCAIAVTEPDAGSDVAGLRTRARRDGDGWVIDGAKMFITNGALGDLLIVAARTGEAGSRGLSLFLVPRTTPGVEVTRRLDKHGWRCSDTAALSFDGVRVPEGALLGGENRGFYAIMQGFEHERLVLAAAAVGEAQKAIELTLDHVRARRAFGKTLWDQQATRQRLAELASRTAMARAFVYQTALAKDAGRPVSLETSMIKATAPEVLHDVVHGCLQLHGGTGYMTGTPIERMARDARIHRIGGGATEVMLEEVAKRI